jgi:hypothetical protein
VPSSIEDLNSNFISLYPNPTSGSLILSSPNEALGVLEIFNVEGKRVALRQTYQSGLPINVQDLNSGIYSLRFTTKMSVQTKSFVKE